MFVVGFLMEVVFHPTHPLRLGPVLTQPITAPQASHPLAAHRPTAPALPHRLLPVACCCCSRLKSSSAAITTAAALFTLCLSSPHALTSPSPFCLNFYFARGVTFGIRPLISFSLSDVPSTAERSVGGTLLFSCPYLVRCLIFIHFVLFCYALYPPRTNLVSICFCFVFCYSVHRYDRSCAGEIDFFKFFFFLSLLHLLFFPTFSSRATMRSSFWTLQMAE
ncbi:hypothetical protein I7I48_03219 [Histoplasma ohiense]|nr:hypothetical protein I7I48_03219 [Histoplasma ohiense (nom. inval.)]